MTTTTVYNYPIHPPHRPNGPGRMPMTFNTSLKFKPMARIRSSTSDPRQSHAMFVGDTLIAV